MSNKKFQRFENSNTINSGHISTTKVVHKKLFKLERLKNNIVQPKL